MGWLSYFLTLAFLGTPPATEAEGAPAPAGNAPGALHQVEMGNGAVVSLALGCRSRS